MSDPAQTSAAAPIEPTLWQRIVDAVKDMARPFTIYAGGAAVYMGAVHNPTFENLGVAAAMTGFVGWAHGDTKVKLAGISTREKEKRDN